MIKKKADGLQNREVKKVASPFAGNIPIIQKPVN